jgi:BlaI family penicillinase repressor
MDNKFDLSDKEEQMLETMWKQGRPLTRSDIINLTENRRWKESSIHVFLNRLLDKGSIRVCDIVKTSTNFGRTYEPTFSAEEYDIARLKQNFETIDPEHSTISDFFSFIVKSKKINKNDLEDLEDIIKNHKNKI